MSIDLQSLNEQVRELQPPSARDRLIFEAVVVKGRGQCEVAAEHEISQPRVSQIVAEVGSWLDRSLPRGQRSESAAGGMAVGEYVAMAQIDFLLQQTLQDIAESKKDKVTEKSGTRGDVPWTETKTEGRQIVPVGLLNVASRLALAKAKLAGVDVTGRTQRERALAEVRSQGSEIRSQVEGESENEESKTEKPLIQKIEISEAVAGVVQPQVLAETEDKLREERDEFVKNTACKQLINQMRRDPECAGWSEEQFLEHAQFVWDLESREGCPPADSIKFSLVRQGETSKRYGLRRQGSRHSSPEERRRKFLAPLAAG
ncbi:MAG: hypothetical protein ACKVP0_16750 [Pirellulaceae bacterium]